MSNIIVGNRYKDTSPAPFPISMLNAIKTITIVSEDTESIAYDYVQTDGKTGVGTMVMEHAEKYLKLIVRNLHLEKIYYDSPLFLDILSDLDIAIEPERDKRALRRFIMGEKLILIEEPVHREVNRSIEMPATFETSGDVDSFFSSAKEALLKELNEIGIPLDKIKAIDCFDDDGTQMFDVQFMALEKDGELAVRQTHAAVFNQILANKDEIYARIDK